MKRNRRGTAVISVAVLLCIAAFYSRGIRRIALGEQFQYIPRESEMIIAVGDFPRLWAGANEHFGALFAADGPLKDVDLEQLDLPVLSLGALTAYGIDARRGMLISVYRPTAAGDAQYVAVLPVADLKALLGFLHQKGGPSQPFTIRDPRRQVTYSAVAFRDLDLFAAFPEPQVAVLTNARHLLERSLTLRDENLAHAANNDSLYHAVRHVAHGPLFVDPAIFVYWQSRTAPFDERAAIVRLSRGEIRMEGEFELSGGTLKLLDRLRRRSPTDPEWAKRLPEQTLGLAYVQDAELEKYGTFFGEEVRAFMPRFWKDSIARWAPGTQPPDVQRIALAVTDVEDGVPDFMLGFWGEQAQLEKQLPLLQRELRRARDLVLLNGALAKYREDPKAARKPPTLAELEELRLLSPEEGSLFHRYPIGAETVGEPSFRNEDFRTSTYERTIRGRRIRFLAPPLGANDVRYRPDLAAADPANLRSDRYRMATVFEDGALWIASDVRDLDAFLSRDGHARPSVPSGPDGAKLYMALDIDRFVEAALLAPGSDLETFLRKKLPAARDFSRFELDAVPSLDERRLHFSAVLRKKGNS